MKKRLAVLFPLLTLGVAMSTAITARGASDDWKAQLDKATDVYFDEVVFHFSPSSATVAGIHKYDDQMEDFSRENVNTEIAALKKFEARFQAIHPSDGPADFVPRTDREIILANIHSELLTLETIRFWEKDADNYSSACANAAFVLMERKFASPDDRLRSLVARESQMPALLADARVNLKNPPKIYTEIAIEQLPDIISFFQNDVPSAFTDAKDPALKAHFAETNAKVIAELESYLAWLKTDLLPRSNGDFRIGADTFSKKLAYDEMVDTPLDKLLEIGWADLRKNQAHFREVAKELEPNKDVPAAHQLNQGVQEPRIAHPRQQPKAVLRKHQIGRFAGQVGRRADGDTDIRPGQPGTVIQAIADHRRGAVARSALIESGPFGIGLEAGPPIFDADGRRETRGRPRVIAGQQHHPDPESAQCLDGSSRLGQRRVVERKHGTRPAGTSPLAPTDIYDRMAAGDHRIGALDQDRGQRPAQLVHPRRTPGRNQFAVDRAQQAAPGHDANILRGDRIEPARSGRQRDGTRQTMLGMALQARQPCEHLILPHLIARKIDQMRPARSQRAGLVEGDQARDGECFERVRVADQAAVSGQLPDAERVRQRRGQADCARTGHHQHRQRREHRQIERQAHAPIGQGQAGESQHQRHEGTSQAVGDALRAA